MIDWSLWTNTMVTKVTIVQLKAVSLLGLLSRAEEYSTNSVSVLRRC